MLPKQNPSLFLAQPRSWQITLMLWEENEGNIDQKKVLEVTSWELGMVTHTCKPVFRRLRPEDEEFKASLGKAAFKDSRAI